ncbi:MAG: hypothetical protein HZA15_04930 [Nitrospirae bacterium]|nr:hypothetical protein [Nitrospirota bacterium]
MMSGITIDSFSLWQFFLATVAFVFLFIEVGYLLGRRHRQKDPALESSVSAMAGATAGLLAFMLAFTFGSAASRHDSRKHMLLEETNAIGTTYLRAALLPDSHREEVRRLLRDYVDLRVKAPQLGKAELQQAVVRSEALQDQLWEQAVEAGQKSPGSITTGLFIQSLNELIDLHLKRLTVAIRNRVPVTIWGTLFFLAAMSMFMMGYRAGLVGSRSFMVSLALVLSFTGVMFLIADLDRPQQGLIRVSQQAMVELQNKFNRDLAPLAPGYKRGSD